MAVWAVRAKAFASASASKACSGVAASSLPPSSLPSLSRTAPVIRTTMSAAPPASHAIHRQRWTRPRGGGLRSGRPRGAGCCC